MVLVSFLSVSMLLKLPSYTRSIALSILSQQNTQKKTGRAEFAQPVMEISGVVNILQGIVRRFLRNLHIMRVALAKACPGNTDKLRIVAKLVQSCRTAIPHT